MNDWRRRGIPEQQIQQEETAQQRSEQEEAEIADRRRRSEASYQQLMDELAAQRAKQRVSSVQRSQLERAQAEAGLKAQAWASYSGTAESFAREWPATYAMLQANARQRQHAIDRACGPYSLSETGLMPHRLCAAESSGSPTPDALSSESTLAAMRAGRR